MSDSNETLTQPCAVCGRPDIRVGDSVVHLRLAPGAEWQVLCGYCHNRGVYFAARVAQLFEPKKEPTPKKLYSCPNCEGEFEERELVKIRCSSTLRCLPCAKERVAEDFFELFDVWAKRLVDNDHHVPADLVSYRDAYRALQQPKEGV